MKTYFENNPDVYKKLIKDLIVQSLIRLMEADVYVMCRKSDESVVQSVLDDAAAEYKKLMAEKVKKLDGKEPPLNIQIDTTRYLNEYSETDLVNSCSGGVQLHARRGKIVVPNTLDDRIQLCYQEAIPEIRKLLFPTTAQGGQSQ